MAEIKRGEYQTREWYTINFYREPNCGSSFPCDEHGNPDGNAQYFDCWYPNYLRCMASNPSEYPVAFKEIEKHTKTWKDPDELHCECGEWIPIVGLYMGAFECEECGRWHNAFGQLLNPPSTWRNGDDW